MVVQGEQQAQNLKNRFPEIAVVTANFEMLSPAVHATSHVRDAGATLQNTWRNASNAAARLSG